eukprot:11179587-Lingulodinium_polyedra.AAC.1
MLKSSQDAAQDKETAGVRYSVVLGWLAGNDKSSYVPPRGAFEFIVWPTRNIAKPEAIRAP